MINMRTFDLNLLRVFEALSHDRSVSLAAAKLGMSQPALSNALNRLRIVFDDPLFVRTRRGMQPTPKAEQLALTLHEGLATIRAGLSSSAAFDPATSERRFTLLMTDVGELSFLPVVLSTLSKSAPKIDLCVRHLPVERYGELLESGGADLAIGRLQLADTLKSELIHSSPFVVLASQTNRYLTKDAEGRATLSFEDYIRAPHVEIESYGASGNPVKQALGSLGPRRRVALILPHTTVLPRLIEGTDLLATIPKVCADKLITMGAVCAVSPPFPIEQNFVYQWWHRRNDSDNGNRWLRKLFATAGV